MRLVILAHDTLVGFGGKTARGVYFYSPHDIVAIVDRKHAGMNASQLFPGRRDVPIYRNIMEVPEDYDTLIVGSAPIGGKLPKDWREEIKFAIREGKTIVSGLHDFLSEDDEFRKLAEEYGAKIWDVRKPPENLRVADGSGRGAPTVLVVGTDCSVGKMVTAIELHKEALNRGMSSAFVATGQTGIMVGCDEGYVIDRIAGDFMAGAVEEMVNRVKDREIIFVEGQGDLVHPAYSGVTLAILHGSYAKKIILAHDPTRKGHMEYEEFPIIPLEKSIELYEKLAEPISGGKVVGISIDGENITLEEIERYKEKIESELGLPAEDVLRFGVEEFFDRVIKL